jgi:hypothetical protein
MNEDRKIIIINMKLIPPQKNVAMLQQNLHLNSLFFCLEGWLIEVGCVSGVGWGGVGGVMNGQWVTKESICCYYE